jgi:hypothetical protein
VPWELASPFGIYVDQEAGAWHTGRVRALLPVQGTEQLLIGSDAGGVWESYPADEFARPLSNDWDDPDIRTLIQGPDPSLVFAGTANGSLYVSDVSGAGSSGIAGFRKASLGSLPRAVVPAGIQAGVVEPSTGRLVLACDNGLLWSDIAPPGGDYAFFAASGAVGAFSDVAIESGGTVIAAGNGSAGSNAVHGLFIGSWSAGQLSLAPSAIDPAISVGSMGRTAVVTCGESDSCLTFAFAVTTKLDPKTGWEFMAVLRSVDAGASWVVCPAGGIGGNQGDFNLAIAMAAERNVGDYREINVAVALRRGPYISTSGGDSWVEHGDVGSGSGKSPHLHPDIHALVFDSSDPLRKTLFVGSDGGVARTQDLGSHWQSERFNKRLPILEFAGSNTRIFGGYRGGASAAPDVEGLVAGGLQDNADVWAQVRPDPAPWVQLKQIGTTGPAGGDGGYVRFLASDSDALPAAGLGLACDADTGSPFQSTSWDGSTSTLSELGVVPIVSAPGVPANPGGIGIPGPNQWTALAAVTRPHWPEPYRRVLAVCGSGSSLFGLMSWPGKSTWLPIGSVSIAAGDWITAVASWNGETIWAGTNQGRIFSVQPDLDPSKAVPFECGVALPANRGEVKYLLELPGTTVFAAFDRQLTELQSLSFNPLASQPSNDFVRSLVYEPREGVVYLAYDRTVWEGKEQGTSWTLLTDGLPAQPHCSELFVSEAGGTPILYLATWGRSVFSRSL